jgi:hypothetical protein
LGKLIPNDRLIRRKIMRHKIAQKILADDEMGDSLSLPGLFDLLGIFRGADRCRHENIPDRNNTPSGR